MFPYLLVYLGSTLVDCIPVFAPPAWTLMILLMTKFDLNPWIVVCVGTMGTVSGRLLYLSFIMPWVGEKALSRDKQADLTFLGEKLGNRGWAAFLFVFIYSLLPLSTTALFTAAGLAKVNRAYVIPPFFLGNLIGDAILVVSGKYAFQSMSSIFQGSWNLKSILLAAFGLFLVLALLFIDWRTVLQKKKLKLKFAFWKLFHGYHLFLSAKWHHAMRIGG